MELPPAKEMKDLAAVIGERVSRVIKRLNLKSVDLSKIVAEDTGLKASTISVLISNVKSGSGIQYLPYKEKAKTKTRPDGAEKLMYLLKALGIPKKDKLITRIKKLYPHVVYPPI